MTQRKAIDKKANSKGVVFALVSGPAGFEVWKLAENYAGHCKGGITRTWRYIQKNMDEVAAKALFTKRISS
jgi:hypothetical protein